MAEAVAGGLERAMRSQSINRCRAQEPILVPLILYRSSGALKETPGSRGNEDVNVVAMKRRQHAQKVYSRHVIPSGLNPRSI